MEEVEEVVKTNIYNRGKIYKILSNVTNEVYFGSTTEPTLARRLSNHKSSYNYYLKDKTRDYMTSFKILETGNYEIILVESCNCNSKDELRARERYYVENNECVNRCTPGRTKKEYIEDTKEHIKKYEKQYREANKEIIHSKYNVKYDCECGGRYTHGHKFRHNHSKKHLAFIQSTE